MLKNAQKLKFPFHWFLDKNFVTKSKIAFQNKQWMHLVTKTIVLLQFLIGNNENKKLSAWRSFSMAVCYLSITTCKQRLLLRGPKGGSCTPVRLYFDFPFIFLNSCLAVVPSIWAWLFTKEMTSLWDHPRYHRMNEKCSRPSETLSVPERSRTNWRRYKIQHKNFISICRRVIRDHSKNTWH